MDDSYESKLVLKIKLNEMQFSECFEHTIHINFISGFFLLVSLLSYAYRSLFNMYDLAKIKTKPFKMKWQFWYAQTYS